jgi:hypothetical protein
VHWKPASWDGVPSEAFTAIEQVCHVRDIEIEGYRCASAHAGGGPALLASIDSESSRCKGTMRTAHAGIALQRFRAARAQTSSCCAASTTPMAQAGGIRRLRTVTLRALSITFAATTSSISQGCNGC